MFRLAVLLYAIVGTSLAGILMVAALASGFDTARYVIIAAASGALIGIPVAYLVARAVTENG